MKVDAWIGEVSAPVVVAVGFLTCFLGYRLLKLTLGLMGFIGGAAGGWAIASTMQPGNSGMALGCAVVGAILGAVLYIWLFYLGIFLLGASAGAVVAEVFFNAVGRQAPPIPLFAVAIVFGLLALAMRKIMMITSTAMLGSYLVTAGLFHMVTGLQHPSPLWFEHGQPHSAGTWGYVAMAFWAIFALFGAKFQNRAHRTNADKSTQPL
jgi:Domain of unknown function (DUF4203)